MQSTITPEELELFQQQITTARSLYMAMAVFEGLAALVMIIVTVANHIYLIGGIVTAVLAATAAVSLYMLRHEQQASKALTPDLVAEQVSGPLHVRLRAIALHGSFRAVIVGHKRLPQLVYQFALSAGPHDAVSVLKPFKGQTVTAEYFPAIKKNRRVVTSDGRGFDFVARKAL